MILNFKTRRVLAGAVVCTSLLALAAGPQIDTSNGVTLTPGESERASTPPPSAPDLGAGTGIGGSGSADSPAPPKSPARRAPAAPNTDGGVRDAGG